MAGERNIEAMGDYRRYEDEMQIVSGAIGRQKIHFEAPLSNRVKPEMAQFNAWVNGSAPREPSALPALTRPGIAHLYFESIHP